MRGTRPGAPAASRRARRRRGEPAAAAAAPSAGAPASRRAWIAVALAGVALAVIAFAGSIGGEFVYDDRFQIVENPSIQEPARLPAALVSDVWSFRGADGEPRSNYWRPAFIAWLALNHALFGLEPAGWHATSVLLHAVAVVLATLVLRRAGIALPVAAAAVWVFAAHPAHVESVAWISGSPDLLYAVLLLASLAAWLAARDREVSAGRPGGGPLRAAALAAFALALLAKETAIALPLVIAVTAASLSPPGPARARLGAAARAALPFAAVAAAYLAARIAVLGMIGRTHPWSPSPAARLLSLPGVIAFYLRQVFWPATLSPAYPVRPVEPADVTAQGFVVPLVLVAAAAAAAAALLRRGHPYPFALAIAAGFLAPALHISAFLPEQIVHDRYLYLPLLGFALAAGQALGGRLRTARGARAWLAGAAAVSAVLCLVTVRESRVWATGIALWERAVAVDPRSTHTLGELANAYRLAGRRREAGELFERAARIRPDVVQVMLGQAMTALDEKRYADAEAVLERILATYPDNAVAVDNLGLVHSEQGRLADAARVYEEGRRRIPRRLAVYTINLAIVRARAGDTAAAIRELESLRPGLAAERRPEVLRAHYLLALLYQAGGRPAEAAGELRRYLERTGHLEGEPGVAALRADARQRLRELGDP